MKAKDVIKAVAEALRLPEVQDFCDGKNTAQEEVQARGEAETEKLLKFFNQTETDVAASAVPLIKEETVVSVGGKISFDSLSENYLRAVRLSDLSGNRIAFSEGPEYLKTGAAQGVLRYAYLPKEKSLSAESDFRYGVPMKVFVNGVIAKYYFDRQMFEEAAVYQREYDAAARIAHRIANGGKFRTRRWR